MYHHEDNKEHIETWRIKQLDFPILRCIPERLVWPLSNPTDLVLEAQHGISKRTDYAIQLNISNQYLTEYTSELCLPQQAEGVVLQGLSTIGSQAGKFDSGAARPDVN